VAYAQPLVELRADRIEGVRPVPVEAGEGRPRPGREHVRGEHPDVLVGVLVAPHNIDGMGTPVPTWASIGRLLNRTR
jgi:hypothetical protein